MGSKRHSLQPRTSFQHREVGVQHVEQMSVIEVAQEIDPLGWLENLVEQATETQIRLQLPDLVDQIEDLHPGDMAR